MVLDVDNQWRMNIAVRADGGLKMGMGHLMRCCAIVEQFLAIGSSVRFYCSYGSDGISWLKTSHYNVTELPDQLLEDECYGLIRTFEQDNIDLVIFDSYQLTDEYISKVYHHGFFTVCIDDNELYHYKCDMIINSSLGAEKMLYWKSITRYKLLGGKYSILRKEFIETEPTPFREPPRSILIIMGGSDSNNYSIVALNGLYSLYDFEIHLVCGPLMQIPTEILNAECKRRIEIHSNPHCVAEIMQKCVLAVSAGGGTVRELFAMGVVPLIVLQADNQYPLADFLASISLPLCLGNYTEVGSEAINKAMNELIKNTGKRKAYRERIMTLADRRGAMNVVEGIQQALNRRLCT